MTGWSEVAWPASPHDEPVTVNLRDLEVAFGYFALAPFSSTGDCAEKAQRISSCLDALRSGRSFEEWAMQP